MGFVGRDLDEVTRIMHEGTLTTGEKLIRPHRGRPMFVGAQLTGFRGDWITKRSCLVCGRPHDIGRCVWCQAGICQDLSGPKSAIFAICDMRVNRSIQSAIHIERFKSSDSTSQHQHFLLRVIAILAMCRSFSAIL